MYPYSKISSTVYIPLATIEVIGKRYEGLSTVDSLFYEAKLQTSDGPFIVNVKVEKEV